MFGGEAGACAHANPSLVSIGLIGDQGVVGGGACSVGIDIKCDVIIVCGVRDELRILGAFFHENTGSYVSGQDIELGQARLTKGVKINPVHIYIGNGVVGKDEAGAGIFGPDAAGGAAVQGAITYDAGISALGECDDIRVINPGVFVAKVP